MNRARGFDWLVVTIAMIKAAVAILASVVGLPVGVVVGSSIFLLNLHVLVHGGAAVLLLVWGRGDPRAFPLGAAFALLASLFADPLLVGLADQPDGGQAWLVRPLLHLQVAAFIPLFFWRFVQVFPGPAPYGRVRHALDMLQTAALAFGIAFLGLHLAQLAFSIGGNDAAARVLLEMGRFRDPSPFWLFFWILLLPAFIIVPWKGATGPAEEARRARWVLLGVIGGLAPLLTGYLAMNLLSWAAAALRQPEVQPWWSALAHAGVLSIPASVTYAVLVDEALQVRLVVRMAIRYALARYTALALIVGPFLVVGAILVMNREVPLDRVLSDARGLILLGSLVTGIALLAARHRLLEAIDRQFFREHYDARHILADLADRSRRVHDVEGLARVLKEELERSLHPRKIELLLRDPDTRALTPLEGQTPPLPEKSVLARRLAARGSVLRVDPLTATPASAGLSEAEQYWLLDAAASVLLPLVSEGGPLLGLVVLGEKRSEAPFSAEDLDLLATVAVSAATTLEGLARDDGHRYGAIPPAAPAREAADECRDCGAVQAAGSARCRRCGGQELSAAEGPLLVGGKYRLIERVGRGGMGVVYLGKDVRLGRDVAIKTLPKRTASDMVRLKKEARYIASVNHPHLAVIYEVESWRGVPILILEYLHGGTLRERIEPGGLPVPEVIELGVALCSVLGSLHERGLLHRDVKPGNIGFAGSGHAKLLDLGLARLDRGGRDTASSWAGSLTTTASGLITGTVPYLSPELVEGSDSDARQDLWAAALVLYEALAGTNPLLGTNLPDTIARIVRADVPDVRLHRPDVPAPFAELLVDALARDPHRRPSSAMQVARRLRALRAEEERVENDAIARAL